MGRPAESAADSRYCWCYLGSPIVTARHQPGRTGQETGTRGQISFGGPNTPNILIELILFVPCSPSCAVLQGRQDTPCSSFLAVAADRKGKWIRVGRCWLQCEWILLSLPSCRSSSLGSPTNATQHFYSHHRPARQYRYQFSLAIRKAGRECCKCSLLPGVFC